MGGDSGQPPAKRVRMGGNGGGNSGGVPVPVTYHHQVERLSLTKMRRLGGYSGVVLVPVTYHHQV